MFTDSEATDTSSEAESLSSPVKSPTLDTNSTTDPESVPSFHDLQFSDTSSEAGRLSSPIKSPVFDAKSTTDTESFPSLNNSEFTDQLDHRETEIPSPAHSPLPPYIGTPEPTEASTEDMEVIQPLPVPHQATLHEQKLDVVNKPEIQAQMAQERIEPPVVVIEEAQAIAPDPVEEAQAIVPDPVEEAQAIVPDPVEEAQAIVLDPIQDMVNDVVSFCTLYM